MTAVDRVKEHSGVMTMMKKCRKFSVCDGSDMQKIGVLGAMHHEMHHKKA